MDVSLQGIFSQARQHKQFYTMRKDKGTESNRMKVVVLIDNNPGTCAELQTEHGLSIYMESGGRKILLDTGASGKFAENAAKLHVDISEVDVLILSHAHRDHTGGLAEFLKLNDRARIFLSAHIAGTCFTSTRGGVQRDISPDFSLFKTHPERFTRVTHNVLMAPNIEIICRFPHFFDQPQANRTLFANNMPDDFRHEIALLVHHPQGNIIFSSCSHHGILNTLAACGNPDAIAYIGGTHLLDSDSENQYETDAQIAAIARKTIALYPQIKLFTGHCTGIKTQKIFSEILQERFAVFYSGFQTDIFD